jgi:HSP20 family molecular chaperone IbpA
MTHEITKFPSINSFPSLFRKSLFDEILNGMDGTENAFFQKGGSPCDIVEIHDSKGNVIANEFSYALAGYNKDNVNIEIDGKTLTISVEKHNENEDKNKKYIHRGLTHKKQQWSYVLNNTVDVDKVNASMIDGILKVTVPITPKKEIKKISVR